MERKRTHRAIGFGGAALLCVLLAGFLGLGCSRAPETPRPIVVLAIDGGEWSVIEELWAEGELPNLAALAERGTRGELRTAYDSKSPVVWTTVATGVEPNRHGIVDFVLTTERGDVPVTSTARRVPAIWNMLSAAGRRVAVLGWWASWPPEEVDGVVLSDRSARSVEDRTSPLEWWSELEVGDEVAGSTRFPPGVARDQDEIVAAAARRLDVDDFDLQLIYLRSPDTMSHAYWRYFRPDRYPPLPPDALARYADRIPHAYRAIDEVLGEILERARKADREPNLFVISDHGFYGMKRERRRIACSFDTVLADLGFLHRRRGEIDAAKTRVQTHASPRAQATKLLRTPQRNALVDGELTNVGRELERELGEALERYRYRDGAPLFEIRRPTADEIERGAELVAEVRPPAEDEAVVFDDALAPDVVEIELLSGSHGGSTHGIVLAAGPDIDPAADLRGIRIHDVTPTLLFGLGLPVARDFDGRAWTPLFREEFREAHPLRYVKSWGTRDATGATESEFDGELLQELEALGYL